jgi:hypothetical protein
MNEPYVDYSKPSSGTVYTIFEVLPVLRGKPWSQVTYSIVLSLNPSSVRVIPYRGAVQLSCSKNRITVYLAMRGEIDRVEMELHVPVFEDTGIGCGTDLDKYLKKYDKSEAPWPG